MKTSYFFKGIACILLSLLFVPLGLRAEQAKTDICEGYDFWFAVPYSILTRTTTEGWADAPAMISITARNSTWVVVESGDGVSLPRTDLFIPAGGVGKVKLPENIFLSENDSEKPSNKGIHISSAEPVSVVVFTAFCWASESFRVYPSEWVGKRYYTLNLYQDKFGDHLCPPEFVVVATEDATSVTYTPKVATGKVSAGSGKSVTLQKGQTLLVLGKPSESVSWNTDRSDLTGSLITSNKPVAVISGHTKAAYPQFPDVSQNLSYEYPRNTIFEMMPPVEHCGKEFIIVSYYNTNRCCQTNNSVGGINSMLRFVATESGTFISKAIYNYSQNSIELVRVSNSMLAGEMCDIVVKYPEVAYYVSNKPVLAGLYNFSWSEDVLSSLSRSGASALIYCIPIERWISRAIIPIEPTSGYENYLYVTFKTSDLGKLYYNGQTFSSKFGSGITSIAGTPYSYMISKVNPGLINIYGTDSARFGAFSSSSFNGTMDARFLASQTDYNYSKICSDSLEFHDQTNCGTTLGSCKLIGTGPDTTCLEFFAVNVAQEDILNYSFTPISKISSKLKEYKYSLTVADPTKPAYAKVRFFTKSGTSDYREFTYSPQIPQVDREHLDFGFRNPNDSDSCIVFHLNNAQTYPLTVGPIGITHNNPDFSIDLSGITFPIQLAPGQSIPISVWAKPQTLSHDWIRDTIRIANDCFQVELPLYFANKQSIAQASDINFEYVIVDGIPTVKKFNVNNVGQYSMQIDSMKFTVGKYYSFPNEITFPIYVAAGSASPDFGVQFLPTDCISYFDTIRVYTNALPGKLYSLLSGTGVPLSADDEADQKTVSVFPSATSDMFQIVFDTPNGLSESRIELFDVMGARTKLLYEGPVEPGRQSFGVSAASLALASGMYVVRIESNGKSYLRKVAICR